MSLRIRQIVVAASDLDTTVEQFTSVFGVQVGYRDPAVAKFGLVNAMMVIGDQLLEVVSPTKSDAPAARHIARNGDSAYMLILQTDDLEGGRIRLAREQVRVVYETARSGIRALHLHPKDIGGAIVSLDQAEPAESWAWAGDNWQQFANSSGAQRVTFSTVGAINPAAMAQRWANVLGTAAPVAQDARYCIPIDDGELRFETAETEVISEFGVAIPDPARALTRARDLGLSVDGNTVRLCGTRFVLECI